MAEAITGCDINRQVETPPGGEKEVGMTHGTACDTQTLLGVWLLGNKVNTPSLMV